MVQGLKDLSLFKNNKENPIDFTHVGTLFVLDQTKDGKFYLEELIDFANLYFEKLNNHKATVDFMVMDLVLSEHSLHQHTRSPIWEAN